MKSLTKLMVGALVALTYTPSLFAQQVSVTLDQAGTLGATVGFDKLMDVTSLKVAGPMNGSDLKTLREMLGRNYVWGKTDGKLTDVDLSDATMVEGGDSYAAALGTETSGDPVWMYARANALPENLFALTNLKSIKLPKSITGIYSSFNRAYQLSGTVEIPEGVLFLGEYAFAESAIEEIKLPSTLVDGPNKYTYNKSALGSYAFAGCGALKSISFPAGVTLLKTCAFANCTSLEEVHIPVTLTEISGHAFEGCTGITDFYVDSPTPPSAGWEAFKYMNFDNCVLHVQAGSEMLFADTDEWCEFEAIRGIDAPMVKATIISAQGDFAGVDLFVDGKLQQMPAGVASAQLDLYVGSRVKVYERDTHRMTVFEATDAKTSRKDDGAFAAVVSADGAVISIDFEECIISVETMRSYQDGKYCGMIKMIHNGNEVSFADLKVGEYVDFVAVPEPGFEFAYITRVYDGSDDSEAYAERYIARKDDCDEPVIFKGVFDVLGALDDIAAAGRLTLDGSLLIAPNGATVYDVHGRAVASVASSYAITNLPAGIYIAVGGADSLKFVVK